MSSLPIDRTIERDLAGRRHEVLAERRLAEAELRLASRRIAAIDEFLQACEDVAQAAATPRPAGPRRESYGAVKRDILAVLEAAPDEGMSLADLAESSRTSLGRAVKLRSVASTLSRLKERGLVENHDYRWRLTTNGRRAAGEAVSRNA